ncbi:MAG: MFS transporter [Candidatus Limnocylindria bacterium]
MEEAADRRLWRNRDFRIVLAGQGLSALGDAVTFTALPLLVLFLTGSGVQMGVVGVLQMLPDLIFGLPSGALADRWDRRRILIATDLARAGLTALIPLSMILGLPTMAVVFAVTGPINVARVLFMAAFTASVPRLVGRPQIGPANSYIEAGYSLGFIVGPAIAGILAATIGPGPTLGIDAASFGLSAASLMLVRRSLQARSEPATTHFLADIRDGIAFVARHATLRTAIVFWTGMNIAFAPIVAALTYYITLDRGLGPDAVGIVVSAYGVGSLLGAIAATRLTRGAIGRVILAGGAVTGLMTAALVLFTTVPPMFVLSLVTGISNTATAVCYITLRTAVAPDVLLGRVGSTARTITLGLSPLGMLGAGFLLDATNGATTLLVMGGFAFVLSVAFVVPASLRTARVNPLPGTADMIRRTTPAATEGDA